MVLVVANTNADLSGGALASQIARELAEAEDYARVTATNTKVEQDNRVVPDGEPQDPSPSE